MNIANKLTFLRILLIPVMAVVYCLGWRIAAAVIFVLAAVTDILDGSLHASGTWLRFWANFWIQLLIKC